MKRIDGIDIARGVLALSVAIYHYIQFLDIGYLKKIHGLMTAGVTSVDGFFIISGFALYYSYHQVDFTQTRNLKVYFYKRFARIAPLFYLCMLLNIVPESLVLLTLALLFCLSFLDKRKKSDWAKYPFLLITLILFAVCLTPLSDSYEKRMMLNNFFFTFGFINTNLTQVRGGWSIGIEYVFYFLLPFILCLTKTNLNCLMALGLFTVFLSLNYQLLNTTNLYSYNSTEHAQDLISNWPLYTNPLNHFHFFMAGILLFIFYERYRESLVSKQQWLTKMLVVFLVIYFFLDQLVGNASHGYGRIFYSLLTLGIIGLTPFMVLKNNWLRNKLVSLGDISYSVYLMQFPVYSVVIYLTRQIGFQNKPAILLIALLCLLVVSYLVYILYEIPTKRWLIDLDSKLTEKKSTIATAS